MHFWGDLGVIGVQAPKSPQQPLSVGAVGTGWRLLRPFGATWGYAPFPE